MGPFTACRMVCTLAIIESFQHVEDLFQPVEVCDLHILDGFLIEILPHLTFHTRAAATKQNQATYLKKPVGKNFQSQRLGYQTP